jgi:hypothetical protein
LKVVAKNVFPPSRLATDHNNSTTTTATDLTVKGKESEGIDNLSATAYVGSRLTKSLMGSPLSRGKVFEAQKDALNVVVRPKSASWRAKGEDEEKGEVRVDHDYAGKVIKVCVRAARNLDVKGRFGVYEGAHVPLYCISEIDGLASNRSETGRYSAADPELWNWSFVYSLKKDSKEVVVQVTSLLASDNILTNEIPFLQSLGRGHTHTHTLSCGPTVRRVARMHQWGK